MEELASNETLQGHFNIQSEGQADGDRSFFFDPARFIPPLARVAEALNRIGIRDPQVDPHGFLNSLAADYHGRGKGDDEGGMRFGAIELVHMIQHALAYAFFMRLPRIPLLVKRLWKKR